MNYKIIGVALLLSVNGVLPVIDTKEETEQKPSPSEKQCACCKKIIEMINTNTIKLSTQEKEQLIKTMCGHQEEKDISPERMMKQWMIHAALLE